MNGIELPDVLKEVLGPKLKAIQDHTAHIAEHRDALRQLVEEVEAICDSMDEGIVELNRGVDTLSQYV